MNNSSDISDEKSSENIDETSDFILIQANSEEEEDRLVRIKTMPKVISPERAFFNSKTNLLEKTYTYIYTSDGLNYHVLLPKNQNEDLISSLLFVRPLVVRIGILYTRESASQMLFGSGLLLTDKLVLTCAHIFDPIRWGKQIVSYETINVCFSDPAYETYFKLNTSNNFCIQAKIIRRGLIEDNVSNDDELESNATDLALLELEKPVSNKPLNEYFDPKLNLLSESTILTINSELFLIAYNGELTEDYQLKPYRYIKGFENITVDTLNYSHHANYKSISIGRVIQQSSLDSQYVLHNCSTLSGSSGALIIDSTGKFIGIHIGVFNSRKEKTNETFYNQDTFNKFIPINSKAFRTFIEQTILPNIHDDQLKQKWLFNSK